MTTKIPDYLRIHADDNVSSLKLPPADDVSSFWQAYVDATGWRIDKSSSRAHRPKLLPAALGHTDDVETFNQQPVVSKSAAERLANAASRIADRLREFEGSLSRVEGSMAVEDVRLAGVQIEGHISERLEKILEESVVAARCVAAGLYLLDEDTSSLKLRACHGLPKARLSKRPRPLRGALGDLEALVSSCVTIEDIERMDHWKSPEQRGAAIVMSVRGGDLPLGTLWLWDDRPRQFAKANLAAAHLAAGRIAAELERETIRHAASERKQLNHQLRDAAAWQTSQLPPSVPLARNWNVAGWNEQAKTVGGDWYVWDVLPDGSIALAIGSAGRTGVEAGLTAATMRAAWQAHSGYRHQTGQMLQRVNDTLWNTSTEEPRASMLYARIDPETGEGHFAAAGGCQAFIANRYGYRAVSSMTHPLGTSPDQTIETRSLRLLSGDILVLATDGLLTDNVAPLDGRLTQQQLADVVRDNLTAGPEEILTAVRRDVACKNRDADRAMVLLARG